MAAFLLTGAHKPQPPSGELTLDAANPVVAVTIQGIPMRLRVDLDQADNIVLNPDAAARLPVPWEDGRSFDVGRTSLPGLVANATLIIDDRKVSVGISQYGRACCTDADGVIGPDQLPFAKVHWTKAEGTLPSTVISIPMDQNSDTGLSAASDAGNVRTRFYLERPETIATAAAGAELARLWDGRWSSAEQRVSLIFGVSRPARILAFTHPGRLAGFQVDTLLVRLSDFPGKEKLPPDPTRADEVVVAHRLPSQPAWSAIIIGADRLSRCAEITYTAAPRSLTLRCAF